MKVGWLVSLVRAVTLSNWFGRVLDNCRLLVFWCESSCFCVLMLIVCVGCARCCLWSAFFVMVRCWMLFRVSSVRCWVACCCWNS